MNYMMNEVIFVQVTSCILKQNECFQSLNWVLQNFPLHMFQVLIFGNVDHLEEAV